VMGALKAIAPVLRKGNLINIESTIPPLTCRDLVAPFLKELGFEVGKDIFLAHCPERILPGDVFQEIVHNDRIIGGFNAESATLAQEIYRPFLKGQMFLTDITTAELCKLMENTYRDVNIALANELAITAQKLGVDIYKAIEMANRHPRVKFLYPGIGVGGHCLAVDPWFISEVDPEDSTVIMAARRVNDRMPEVIATRIRRMVAGHPNPNLLILGSTYKPETYDPRNSPAMDVVEILRVEGYDLEVYDPNVKQFSSPSLAERLKAKKATHAFLLVPHKALLAELEKAGAASGKVGGIPLITAEELVRGTNIKAPSRAHKG
jgi:UDP-N-acetyl-D-mannosaminuronic acid dehydrogenase